MTTRVIVARYFNKPPVGNVGVPPGYKGVWLVDTEMLDPADDPLVYSSYMTYGSHCNEPCLDCVVAETEDHLIELLRSRIGEPFEDLSWTEKGHWYHRTTTVDDKLKLTDIKEVGVYEGLVRLDRAKLIANVPEREQELGRLIEAATANVGGAIVTWKDRLIGSWDEELLRELLNDYKIRHVGCRWRYTPTARSKKIRCASDKIKIAERAGRTDWFEHIAVMVKALDAAMSRKYTKGYKGDEDYTPVLTVYMADCTAGINAERARYLLVSIRHLTGLMAMLYLHDRSFYRTKDGKEIGKSIAPYMAGLVRRYCRLCGQSDGSVEGIDNLMSWDKYFPVIKEELVTGYKDVLAKKGRQRADEEKRKQQSA
jgi:hypothetical protein